MTATVSNLTTDFPVWYRDVSIEADDALRASRIEGIILLSKDADRDLTEGLVRLAFDVDRHPPSVPILGRIHEGFRGQDSTFNPAASPREVQILASACLVEMFNGSGRMGNIAALSVATASLNKTRQLNLPMDLAALADRALDQQSVGARDRPDLSEYSKMQLFKIGDSFAAPAEGEEVKAVDASDLSTLAKEVQSVLRSFATRQTRMIGSLEKFIKVQDEELQVLWWLLGGRSKDLDCDFAKISPSAQPLVFGKEIADETNILPGLRTVRSLMVRAGLKEKSKLNLPDMINAAPVNWLKKLIDDGTPSPVTQPIHFAISRRLEVSDEKSWIGGWVGISGIKASQKFSALELGKIFYHEQLLRQSQ